MKKSTYSIVILIVCSIVILSSFMTAYIKIVIDKYWKPKNNDEIFDLKTLVQGNQDSVI